ANEGARCPSASATTTANRVENMLRFYPGRPPRRAQPPACQRSISQREIEIDGDSSSPSGPESPRSAAPTSSRVNQRASSSSSLAQCGASGPASASKPSISEDGNGQGCDAR